MRLWPKSLAGQLLAALILALLVAQVIVFTLFANERQRVVRTAHRENVIGRTVALARLLADTPPPLHGRILQAASSRLVRFSLSAEASVKETTDDFPTRRLARNLGAVLGLPDERVRVAMKIKKIDRDARPFRDGVRRHFHDDDDERDEPPLHLWRGPPGAPGAPHARPRRLRWIAFSVQLPGGRWLNGFTGPPPLPPPFGVAFLVSLLLSVIAVCITGWLLARRIVRPIRQLAGAAERLGRGEPVDPLPEKGPVEVRTGTRAFNEMQARIDRFVKDRTHLLAAVSHDLRTPMTSLRLRAELVEDEETRDRLVATVDEMQRMVEATLDFVRAEAGQEETREVDLAALVGALGEDLRELGHKISVKPGERCVIRGRPDALRRALRNVIENAATYGKQATIAVACEADQARVTVTDRGPGIPEKDLQRMFEPFVRGEKSRSRETGGIGLGLAIARTIVRGHGGDVQLANGEKKGLVATIVLPRMAVSGKN